jgi:hypothetical protein
VHLLVCDDKWIVYFLALVIRNATRIFSAPHIVIYSLSGCTMFFHISHKRYDSRGKKLLDIKCIFLFSLQLFHETFLVLRRTHWLIIINSHNLHIKYPLFLSDFSQTWIFFDSFSKNPQISNLMKMRPLGAELFHADRLTWRSQLSLLENLYTRPKTLIYISQCTVLTPAVIGHATVSRSGFTANPNVNAGIHEPVCDCYFVRFDCLS